MEIRGPLPGKTLKILIVDDDENTRYLYLELFIFRGHTVFATANGFEALALVEADTPDIIVSDILMPRMGGFELCRRLKSDVRYCHIPFVFISGNFVSTEEKSFACDLGVAVFLEKPIELKVFTEIVEREASRQFRHCVARTMPHDEYENRHTTIVINKLYATVRELERKNDALEKSEALNRAIVEAIPDFIVLVDRNGRCHKTVHSRVSFPAQNIDEFLGKTVYDVMPAQVAETVLAYIERSLTTGTMQVFEYEIHLQGELFIREARVVRHSATEVLIFVRDNTLGKKAEIKLRESERQYRSLVESIPGAVYCCRDHRGRELHFLSGAFEEITGYPLEEFVTENGQTLARVMHPDDVEIREKLIQRSASLGEVYRVEYRIIHRDGHLRWVHEQGRKSTDSSSGTIRMDGVIFDITAQKKLEQARRVVGMGTWEWDFRTNNSYWSEESLTMLGLPAYQSGLSFDTFLSLVHPQDRAHVYETLRRALVEKKSFATEYRIVRPGGELRYLQVRGEVEFNASGEPARIVGADIDVTDQRVSQIMAQQTSEKLQLIVDHSPIGVIEWSLDGYITDWNKAAEKIFGYSKAEALGRSADEIILPTDLSLREKDELRKNWGSILGGNGTTRFTGRYINKNGEPLICEWSSMAIQDESGVNLFVASLVQDVTERVKAEEVRLARANRQRDDLVREVHHRIKNNLQGISGLLDQYLTDDEKTRAHLETAINYVNTIAMVHGIQGGQRGEDVLLCNTVAGIAQSLQWLGKSGVSINLSVSLVNCALVTKEEAVPVALIVNELIFNAIKHRHDVKKPVQVKLERDEAGVRLIVRNNIFNRRKVFDFDSERGLNNGLSLVKALVSPKGCRLNYIWLENELVAVLHLSAPVVTVNESSNCLRDCPFDQCSANERGVSARREVEKALALD